jgi:hypothetical protein
MMQTTNFKKKDRTMDNGQNVDNRDNTLFLFKEIGSPRQEKCARQQNAQKAIYLYILEGHTAVHDLSLP